MDVDHHLKTLESKSHESPSSANEYMGNYMDQGLFRKPEPPLATSMRELIAEVLVEL